MSRIDDDVPERDDSEADGSVIDRASKEESFSLASDGDAVIFQRQTDRSLNGRWILRRRTIAGAR
jgi:hypothetical protein